VVDIDLSNKNLNELVVTRARKKQIYYDGNEITGFNFGFGGDISCRIYNKSLKSKEKKIKWRPVIWNNNGYSKNMGDVWRIEFQLKREILKQFNVNSPDEVFYSLNSIWKYCTHEWFSVRIKGTDNTKSRWIIEKWWNLLSELEFNSFGKEVVRKIHKDTQFEKIIDGLLAYQTSIAAYFDVYEQKDACYAVSLV